MWGVVRAVAERTREKKARHLVIGAIRKSGRVLVYVRIDKGLYSSEKQAIKKECRRPEQAKNE